MKGILSYYLHTSMNEETAKDCYEDENTTVTWENAEDDTNTFLIETVVEVDEDNPINTVHQYQEETTETLEVYTLAWSGRKFTEEDAERL